MTEEELMRGLIAYVNEQDDDGLLDPDGHYAFAIAGFVRPDNPDKWVECDTRADRMATVACVHFTTGTGSEECRPVEQICAMATKHLTSRYAEQVMRESQAVVRKQEAKLND